MHFIFVINKKRIFIAVVIGLISALAGRYYGGTAKFSAVCFAVFLFAGFLKLQINGRFAWLLTLVLLAGSALFCVVITQEADGIRDLLSAKNYLFGSVCALLPVLVFYLIQLLFSRRDVRLSICLAVGIWLLIAIIGVWTIANRGTMLIPADIFAVRTAVGVLDHYELFFSAHMCYSVIAYIFLVFLLSGIQIEPNTVTGIRLAATAAGILLLSLVFWYGTRRIQSNQWLDQGNLVNGYIFNLSLTLKESIPAIPEGYSEEEITSLENDYAGEIQKADLNLPHIIVIMNEAYADLEVLGSFETDHPVTPFTDSLTENAVHGYAYSSVYGGTTPNSEYEFLTGNSMAFLKAGVPFSQLIRQPQYSLARYLGSLGYSSWATHPMNPRFWNREKVYPLLGITEFESLEGYADAPKLRNYTTDEAVYEHIIRELENRKTDEKKFLYAVTVQNHGAYHVPDDFTEEVRIIGYESVESMVYLSLLHESDIAMQKLIKYLDSFSEPVILLLFGDHQPDESDMFIQFAHGGNLETLDEQMQKYIVPYFIWANFDIEEQQPETTSINYLSNSLLELAGIPLPPYNRFLADIQQTIPAINSFGYYSHDRGCFQAIEEAKGEEGEALKQYAQLEYNAIFDKKNLSQVFFPLFN